MASTHQEVYRRFEGTLNPRPRRFWTVCASSVRVASKRKLPMLLLYIVPGIATCVVSFLVYLKFAAEEHVIPEAFGGRLGFAAEMLARQATSHLAARNQIITFHANMNTFSLLCIAWYGSGLFCNDRRSGAFQLYFSRPLTRVDYFFGKFLCVAFFGILVSFVPALVIFVVASLASPEWAFLKSEWDIIPRAFAFSAVWLGLISGLTLFASSMATRKSFALLGIFAFLGFSVSTGEILGTFVDGSFYGVSILADMQAIAHDVFEFEALWGRVDPPLAWTVISTLTACFFLAAAVRIARLEVVE